MTVTATVSVTLPWPPRELSPNFRTRAYRWVNAKRKAYRKACAQAVWDRGLRPTEGGRLVELVFHAPDARSRDDDNMAARFKNGRDGLAEVLGVDDREFNDIPKRFGTPVSGGAVVAIIEIPG